MERPQNRIPPKFAETPSCLSVEFILEWRPRSEGVVAPALGYSVSTVVEVGGQQSVLVWPSAVHRKVVTLLKDQVSLKLGPYPISLCHPKGVYAP